MQKKYKRAIIFTVVFLIGLTLLLVLLGLGRVQLDQYALNYSKIAANYSDNTVYGPGLYFIGIANKFVRINKNMQTTSFGNLLAYSSDFYKINANLQVSFLPNFGSSSFSSIQNFYVLLGDSPYEFIHPVIQNQIINVLSQQNSTFYQTTSSPNTVLQDLIATRVKNILSKWMSASVSVIVESLVCQGTTSNTQIIDRQIQSLVHDMERVTSQKVEISDYLVNYQATKQFQVQSVKVALQDKSANLQRILKPYGKNKTGLKIAQILYQNKPLKYNMNLVNVLQQLAIIGNRTFPY